MALTGNLSDFFLGDIMMLLHNLKKTGILKLEAAGEDFSGETGEIRFKDGKVINSLTSRGLIGREAIFHFFEYKEAHFTFEDVMPPEEVNIKETIEALVMEGARLITEWSEISSVIKTLSLIVDLSSTPPENVTEIKLSKPEWSVLRMIDGKKTIKNIAEEMKMADFEVSKIIYGLIVSGLVEKKGGSGEKITQAGIELVAKAKPEFYLQEEAVYVDAKLLKEWETKYNVKAVDKVSLRLPDGNEVIIKVKPKDRLGDSILIPEEILTELSLKEKDKVIVEPLR